MRAIISTLLIKEMSRYVLACVMCECAVVCLLIFTYIGPKFEWTNVSIEIDGAGVETGVTGVKLSILAFQFGI